MKIGRNHFILPALALLALVSSIQTTHGQKQSTTFKMAISVQHTIIHENENMGITIIHTNLTNHPVQIGDGRNGGMELELLDEKGKDIGPYITGSALDDNIMHPSFVTPTVHTLIPKRNETAIMYLVFSSKYLHPGKYQLRIHNRELATGSEIYSNSITITLVP